VKISRTNTFRPPTEFGTLADITCTEAGVEVGSAVTVTLSDDGGGSTDASPTQTFDITITNAGTVAAAPPVPAHCRVDGTITLEKLDNVLFVGRPVSEYGFEPARFDEMPRASLAVQKLNEGAERLGTLTGSYEIIPGLRAHVDFGPQHFAQAVFKRHVE